MKTHIRLMILSLLGLLFLMQSNVTMAAPTILAPVAGPVNFEASILANCGTNALPDVVQVRIKNLMGTIKISGEIKAKPDGGTTTIIASVPTAYQTVTTGNWGGPMQQILQAYPNGFVGIVWGYAEAKTLSGDPIGRVELKETRLTCPAVTPTHTPTDTPTVTPTGTPTNTPTNTSTPTPTNTPTNTPTPTPTV